MIDFACRQFDLREVIKCSLGLTRSDMLVFEQLIKRPGRPHTAEEIAHGLGIDLSTAQRAVKKLHEKNILRRTQRNLEGGGYIFEYQISDKRAMRKVILETVSAWTKRLEAELEEW